MSHRSFLDAAELPDNEGPDEDAWHDLVQMPDDDTQTLAGVLEALRDNNLQRQAAFVRWLAEDWYGAKAELQQAELQLDDVLRSSADATIRHGLAIKYLMEAGGDFHERFLAEPQVRALAERAERDER